MNEYHPTDFEELSFYTLSHPDPVYFIHQHIVDAYHAQTADQRTKPITIIFALIGLHLFVNKNYTGRQVQLVHMQLAKNKKTWPILTLPASRGSILVSDVLKAAPGIQRDQMIKEWCRDVWNAYADCHPMILSTATNHSG